MSSLNMESNDVQMSASEDSISTSKYQIYKNLAVVSLGSMIILGADDVLFTLQSTLNSEEGIGVLTAAQQCFVSSVASLLLPKYLINKMGSKAVMILSIILFVPFFAANYYPTWLTMVTSSFLLGIGFSLIWNSVCTYLNDLSSLYEGYCTSKNDEKASTIIETNSNSNKYGPKCEKANLFSVKAKYVLESKGKEDLIGTERVTSQLDSITSRFFGFHSMVYQVGYLWSNFMTYYILQTDSKQALPIRELNHNSSCACGANYCNFDTDCSIDLKQPTAQTRNILISVCLCLTFIAAAIMLVFLENSKPRVQNVSFSMDLLLATLKQTKKKANALLIPLTIYTGSLKGFYLGDYTKSYIVCAWDIRNIGLVTVCGAVTMIVSSSLTGWLVKHVGRMKIFLTSVVVNSILMAILLVWQPSQEEPYVFFISSGLYGALYGTFFTQLRAYYGVIFKEDEEAAFGAFNFWNQIGEATSFIFSIYLCNYIKIYLLVICSNLGILGYIIVEISRSSNDEETTSTT